MRTEGRRRGRQSERFLENLFMASICSESNVEVKLKSAYRITNFGKLREKARDREVLMTFQEGSVEMMVLNTLWEQSKLVVAGLELTFLSDISPVTLRERREWHFLTNKLS